MNRFFTSALSSLRPSFNQWKSSTNLFQFMPQQFFSKYIGNARAKRQPLNTKRAGKGYKKGYGARKEGKLSSLGKLNN